MIDTIEYAHRWLRAGFSVIPLRLDGSKKTSLASWKPFQQRRPTDAELAEWFRRPQGIGIPCGNVSLGFEVLDFDAREMLEPWRSLLPEPLRNLPTIETGGGGFQVYYRCSEIGPNTKLAMEEPRRRIVTGPDGCHRIERYQEVRIETRGQGGYVVGLGSPPNVHASGESYWQVLGPDAPECIPTITTAARALLWRVAREFDCRPNLDAEQIAKSKAAMLAALAPKPHRLPTDGVEPWEWYDKLAPWAEILIPHGWTSTDGIHWQRPGKDEPGFSAVVRESAETGNRVLVVYSTSAGALSPTSGTHRTLGAFEANKLLNHGGDAKQATKAIRSMMKGQVAA